MQEKLLVSSEVNTILPPRPSSNVGLKPSSMLENVGAQQQAKELATVKVGHERSHAVNESRPNLNDSTNNNSSAPATK